MLFMANPKLSAQTINRLDASGLSPLHYACAHGSLTVVKRLVALGADVNAALGGQKVNPAITAPQGTPSIVQEGRIFPPDATPLTIVLRAHCGMWRPVCASLASVRASANPFCACLLVETKRRSAAPSTAQPAAPATSTAAPSATGATADSKDVKADSKDSKDAKNPLAKPELKVIELVSSTSTDSSGQPRKSRLTALHLCQILVEAGADLVRKLPSLLSVNGCGAHHLLVCGP
jgi:hypothetical protein